MTPELLNPMLPRMTLYVFILLQYGEFSGNIDAFVSGCFKAMVIDDSLTPTPEVMPHAQSAPLRGPELTSMEALASSPCPVKQVPPYFFFS